MRVGSDYRLLIIQLTLVEYVTVLLEYFILERCKDCVPIHPVEQECKVSDPLLFICIANT